MGIGFDVQGNHEGFCLWRPWVLVFLRKKPDYTHIFRASDRFVGGVRCIVDNTLLVDLTFIGGLT